MDSNAITKDDQGQANQLQFPGSGPDDFDVDDADASFKPEYDNQKFVPIDSEFLIEHDRLEHEEANRMD